MFETLDAALRAEQCGGFGELREVIVEPLDERRLTAIQGRIGSRLVEPRPIGCTPLQEPLAYEDAVEIEADALQHHR